MLRMLHTRHMPQAVDRLDAPSGEITVDFDASIQSMAALDAAIYRLIGTATCQVDRIAGRYVCRLTPCAGASKRRALSVTDLKERFLNLVADENMRARATEKTEGVRNVILALAFGSLAVSQGDAG
jgi:His-Xaa-Ser system protein HxsD